MIEYRAVALNFERWMWGEKMEFHDWGRLRSSSVGVRAPGLSGLKTVESGEPPRAKLVRGSLTTSAFSMRRRGRFGALFSSVAGFKRACGNQGFTQVLLDLISE